MADPTLEFEHELLQSRCRRLAAVDEVGRGALAGPVSVGVVVIDAHSGPVPAGVRDSKLLPPARRQVLAPQIRHWAPACAVGHASNTEIDEVGIIAALRLAGMRALAALDGPPPDLVLLDGKHDWLTPPTLDLFSAAVADVPPVIARVKADRDCAAVAAASVIAKVERDAHMVELAGQYPDYAWDDNKGYASPTHLAAIRTMGPTALHRISWSLG